MTQPYEDTLELDHSWKDVFQAAQRAVERFPKLVLLVADRETGRIAVMQGMTLRAYGGTIVIDVGHITAGRSRVRIWSAVANLYDPLQRNRSNVNELLSAIDEELNGKGE